MVLARQNPVEPGHPHLVRYHDIPFGQINTHGDGHGVIGAQEGPGQLAAGRKISVQRPVGRLVPVFAVDDFLRRQCFSVFFQNAPAKADPFFRIGIALDAGHHHDIVTAVFFNHMAGNLLKTVPVGKGHINAAFIRALQHEYRQPFFLCEIDDMLINGVGPDHLAQQHETGQVRQFEGVHKLQEAFFSPAFHAAAVEGHAHRKNPPAFRGFNQPVQHKIQVLHILPGCTDSQYFSIR